MARITRAKKAPKPVSRGRTPAHTTAKASKATAKPKAPGRLTALPRRGPAALAAAPKVSKDELRAQVEKLERANATLRAKNKEVGRTAKSAAARIAELEDQLARLEKELAAQRSDPGEGQVARAPGTRRRAKRREIEPGDSVPPGAAVEEAAPPDLEAETARENLEEHLGSE